MATLFFLLPEGAEARPGPGRYEFRCWPRRPPAAVSTLQRAWQLDQCEVRTDIYLLSPLSGHRLVKLRSGSRLETKRLLDRPGPLEYWSDPLAKSFPLEVESLAALAADLGLTGPLPAAAALSPAHLVAELADQVGAVRVRNVRKSRALFTRDSSRIEVTHAHWKDHDHLSIGLEDADARSALTVLRELELTAFPNIHYGEALRAEARVAHRLPAM